MLVLVEVGEAVCQVVIVILIAGIGVVVLCDPCGSGHCRCSSRGTWLWSVVVMCSGGCGCEVGSL